MADMEKVKAVADQIVQITYDNVIVNSGVCLPPSGNIVRAGNKEVSELQETFLGTVLGPLLLIQSILRNRSWTGGCHLVFILKEPINYMKKHWPNESWWTDEKVKKSSRIQGYIRERRRDEFSASVLQIESGTGIHG
ncbi:hypothetical protein PENTCL1PPCAC_17387 [Pristionchus entomophagus]|uniref:Uncharacterized protein n=1 Tax=Pristionchus entomophagus TaxID=358040 RepID=A0AAV5TLS5_9BILA|nr:hypothetical protein PENTCL1PPCAC_17387 [Pristionchus entomophagus]